MKIIVNLIVLLLTSACQTIERDKTSDEIKMDLLLEERGQTQDAYQEAIKPYQQYNFSEATVTLQDYLKKYPVSDKAVTATLMLADSYFQLTKYEIALQWYSKVIEFNKGNVEYTAEALYKSGLCHEFLGNDTKAIATYVDALKRKEKLSFELAKLEIPARLALTYVRIGEFKASKKYFLIAESGVAQIRKKLLTYRDKSAWLAQILYQMGAVSSQIKLSTNLNDVLLSLDHAQDYLLFAAELNDPKWSSLAANEMLNAYEASFKSIQSLTPEDKPDKILARHELQQKQKKMANGLLDYIENLRDKISPETDNNYLKESFKKIENLEKQIQSFVTSISGNNLTEEAKKLEAPKREGQ